MLRYNWILTIILSAVVPLYLLSVWAHSRASFGFARIRRQALQDAAEVSSHSVASSPKLKLLLQYYYNSKSFFYS